ncbi:MAG: beta-galactosidase [Candidatus Omnitrophica bacterium]|nr:beta-galactosidase [Candidatus Omnitrophota bacterium]
MILNKPVWFFICLLFFTFAGINGHASPVLIYVVDEFRDTIIASPQPFYLIDEVECKAETVEGEIALTLPLRHDPYFEDCWNFRVIEPFVKENREFILEIEHYDIGAGIIDVQMLVDDRFYGQWRGADRKVSYTRLNTNHLRSAYFHFRAPQATIWKQRRLPHFKITGLQYLKSIKAHIDVDEMDWGQAKENVPIDVQPMVHLEKPMDIVCSAGVAVLSDAEALHSSLDALHELAPLAKVLGFNAIESYVKWNLIEPEMGRFDFSFYDEIVDKLKQYDLKWLPLLIVGSAYSLPGWFAESEENVGFTCLEHGLSNPIQSIWSPYHKKHVTRVLTAFGKHYEPMNILQGVRLGPSGNYGESQYPAGGNWGYKGEPMHIHIGFWAGDPYAHQDFHNYLKDRYGSIADLNAAWNQSFKSFEEIQPILPTLCYSRWRRLDMTRWYTKSMSDWCDWWAQEARKAMPHTPIYQSAGGWGFLEAGTDYVEQAKSMVKIGGGIRLTNETDSFQQNFYATRLAATAARLYGIDLGFEPASSHTARGTVGRLFNTITTNGDHFFTYHSNIFSRQMAIQKWIDHYEMLDFRQDPIVDVALYYPETMNQLDDGAFRHLYAWGFNPRAREIRRHIEVDYLNEELIREGFLDRYKVLVFIWGNIIDADVLKIIDEWVRKGGAVIYPSFPKGDLETIDGDASIFQTWMKGDAGQGRFYRFPGDMEPPSLYGDYVNDELLTMPNLHPLTQKTLQIQHPDKIFFSVQQDGHILALNFGDCAAELVIPENSPITIEPYSILRIPE